MSCQSRSNTRRDMVDRASTPPPPDMAAGKPVDAVPAIAPPPPESPKSITTRRLVILSFWAVAVLLGLPLWFKTTTIYRANLPLQQMLDWADGKVCFALAPAVLAAG